MLLTVTPLENPGPPSPVPPPTAPKPKKDNARLQRLLRKAAKKSGTQPPPAPSPKVYRSTLSPVNEGDLENPDVAVPQRPQPSPLNLPPRFQTRGSTNRASSPYPKPHSFTFTVVEQHSLSQYLSPSPIPEVATPCTPGSGTHNNAFLFPGGNTADHTSLRVNTNASPRPTTPRHVSFNPTPAKQPAVPLITVSDLPMIVVPESDSQSQGPMSTDETLKEAQNHIVISNVESVHSTIRSPPVQQGPTHLQITIRSESKPTPQETTAPTPEGTKKPEECLRIAEMASNSTTVSSEPRDLNQISAQVCNTDGAVPSKVQTKNLSQEITITAKSVLTTPKVQQSNSTNSPKTEEGNLLKTAKSVVITSLAQQTTSTNAPKTEVGNLLKTANSVVATPKAQQTTSTNSPKAEEGNLLKTPERPKPPRKKPGGGWARLMKHLVVEPEEPTFPEPQNEGTAEKTEEVKEAGTERTQQQSKGLRANKMWDALLYHMATSNKGQEKAASQQGSAAAPAPAPPSLPFLRSRLPLLLHRPRFDARKLREAASRPLRRVTAFFTRKIVEKEPSTFNRTASGWSLRAEEAAQEKMEVQ